MRWDRIHRRLPDSDRSGAGALSLPVRGTRSAVAPLLACLSGLALGTEPPCSAQIIAPAGRTLFNRSAMVRLTGRFDSFEPSAQGEERRLVTEATLVWGAAPHLSLGLGAPVISIERAGAVEGGERRSGLGDPRLVARYDAIRTISPDGYTRLSPELGVKLPWGGALGSGSTDPIVGLVFSHVRGPDWLVADVELTSPGTGEGGARAGRRWRYDLAYLRRLLPADRLGAPMVLLVLELNGLSVERSRREGSTLSETGGTVLFLSPGIEAVVSRRLVLELSFPRPIRSRPNGRQPEPDGSLLLGVRWLF